MDLVSWIIVGGVVVITAIAVMLWNRFGKRGSPIDRLDPDAAKDVREAQAKIERGDLGPRGGVSP